MSLVGCQSIQRFFLRPLFSQLFLYLVSQSSSHFYSWSGEYYLHLVKFVSFQEEFPMKVILSIEVKNGQKLEMQENKSTAMFKTKFIISTF